MRVMTAPLSATFAFTPFAFAPVLYALLTGVVYCLLVVLTR